MEILVVTGGIGSGKSEVCRILSEEFSCGVYNADSRVKLLYEVHPTLLSDIERLVGESLRDDEGRFVPARLSARIFSDRSLLKQVEGMVFPALMEVFDNTYCTVLQIVQCSGIMDYSVHFRLCLS